MENLPINFGKKITNMDIHIYNRHTMHLPNKSIMTTIFKMAAMKSGHHFQDGGYQKHYH